MWTAEDVRRARLAASKWDLGQKARSASIIWPYSRALREQAVTAWSTPVQTLEYPDGSLVQIAKVGVVEVQVKVQPRGNEGTERWWAVGMETFYGKGARARIGVEESYPSREDAVLRANGLLGDVLAGGEVAVPGDQQSEATRIQEDQQAKSSEA